MASPSTASNQEDWNVPSPARLEVLVRLKSLIQRKAGQDRVPPAFWGFCQTADISELDALIQDLEFAPDRAAKGFLVAHLSDSDVIIKRWLQKVKVDSSQSSPMRSGSNRSSTASRNCKERDKRQCVITGCSNPDAAHIYPVCLMNAATREPTAVAAFWNLLTCFWGEERVRVWQNSIPRDCSNMLCLGKQVHEMWGNGKFALKPLQLFDDGKTLEVQFFWQRKSGNGVDPMDLLTLPVPAHGGGEAGQEIIVPTAATSPDGHHQDRRIMSGDKIRLTTVDPERLPLPSWPLLDLQWNLQRVAGMCGAAEVDDLPFDDDDDEDAKPKLCSAIPPAKPLAKSVFDWLIVLPNSPTDFASVSNIQPPTPTSSVTSSHISDSDDGGGNGPFGGGRRCLRPHECSGTGLSDKVGTLFTSSDRREWNRRSHPQRMVEMGCQRKHADCRRPCTSNKQQ